MCNLVDNECLDAENKISKATIHYQVIEIKAESVEKCMRDLFSRNAGASVLQSNSSLLLACYHDTEIV